MLAVDLVGVLGQFAQGVLLNWGRKGEVDVKPDQNAGVLHLEGGVWP